MSTIKDKYGRDLVDTEEIKKRWREYMEEMYEKYLNEPDYYDGVVSYQSHKFWRAKSNGLQEALLLVNNASGCDEIPAELFKSLKNDANKVLHSLCQQIWKTQQWPQDWKRSILIQTPKKGSTKDYTSHWTTALSSHGSE